ncbi:hypothetical protein K438DRAFT_1961206 [Mycena galopus ATCC 62051]|nr:hypothetical protein K438DRAFT_1961206 [Mycena galopus ATCC 62051]
MPFMSGIFKGSPVRQPIALEELKRECCCLTNQPYPVKEIFRLAVISQGIAARIARKQASSQRALTLSWCSRWGGRCWCAGGVARRRSW